MLRPASRAEAERVAEAWQADPLLGPDVTRARVLSTFLDADVVHLACHARFDDDNPLRSSIDLADGGLEAHELLRTRTEVELMVVSACETARE